jgi:hypothetical protein
MSAPATKLNLRPQERRLIAFVAIVVFIVLNIWLVWPHFGDWARIQDKRKRAEKTLAMYSAEKAKTKAYQARLRELESAGSSVIPDEQELDLVRTTDNQARKNGMFVIQLDPRPRTSMTGQTNRFFEEQYVTLHATSDNDELIKFLVSLTSTNSLIRVKDLSLKTADVGTTKLDSTMMLVASYQRRAPSKTAAPASTTMSATTNLAAAPKVLPNRTLSRTNKTGASMTMPHATNKPASVRRIGTNAPAKKP